MKKLKETFVLILFVFIWSCADRSPDNGITNPPADTNPTEISGNINGSLTKVGSPYHVIDTISVAANSSLTIERGVRILFTDSASLIVHGKVTVIGRANDVISFSALKSRWKGIKVINSAQNSTFQFCWFEDIERLDSSQYGGVEINNSTVRIQNCIFRNNYSMQGGGLALLGDSSLISNNIFRDNYAVAFGGGILAVESSSRIINNTIYDNRSQNVGGGLVLWNPVANDIQNNIFFENAGSYPFIHLASGDSSGFSEQYNFLPIGNQNPRFISDDNLHLQAGSPCIDTGNPDSIYDDVDGSRNDQGAYGGPLGNW